MKRGKIFETVYRCRYRYLAGLLMLLLVDYLDLFIPQFVGEVTDALKLSEIDQKGILIYASKMIICALLIAFGRFFWRYFIIGSSHRIQRDIRNEMFKKLEALSSDYYNENKTGDIMAYFTNDLESLEEALGWAVISAFDAVVLTGLCLYKMMSYVSVKLTLFTLIPMVFIGIYDYYIEKAFEEGFTQRQEAFGKLNDAVQESVTAERVIKAFVQEQQQLQQFKEVNQYNKEINLKIARLRSTAWPIIEVFIGAAYVIAIVVGGYYCLLGDISIGRFVTFASYVNTLVWPMLAFGDTVTVFSSAKASIKRLNSVFDEIPTIQDAKEIAEVNTLSGAIKFENVDFRYKKELPLALKNLNFEIKKGEMFAIMGKTGSGKTTIVNLMTRLYDVEKGKISFDGYDIQQIPLHVLRENIGYVPQDNFLFSETLKDNISFGKLDATMDEIIQASKMADIHDNIMDFPEQYQTMVGERGVTLSGGQKQRSSIARALLKDAPILIMDDSLSAVDTDTEDNILNNLKQLRAGKTTIMIAHRVSTVQNADHILVLEDGEIAELGTYQQLLENGKLFAKMVRKQQLEKQLEQE